MNDIQAAIGLAQVKKMDIIIDEKRKRAAAYNHLIKDKISAFITPIEPEGYFHTYQSYVCMLNLKNLDLNSIENGWHYRNALMEKLEEVGIATRQGTHAVHLLGYYQNRFGYQPCDFPNAYSCDRLSITLPLYYGMTDDDQEYIVNCIHKTLMAM